MTRVVSMSVLRFRGPLVGAQLAIDVNWLVLRS